MKVGESDTDKITKSLQKCRQIVGEINNFGINDFERVQIINLLSLEIEDRDLMSDLTSIIKDFRGDLFDQKTETKLLE
jgi:hypothetical protein